MPPIALKGHHHTCPAKCGKVPHVGGPITGGHDIVKVNGIPVALVGDSCACSCATDTITSGAASFTVNGIPVAIQGSATAHGGVVVQGDGSVVIG